MRFHAELVPELIKNKAHGWSDDDAHCLALKSQTMKAVVQDQVPGGGSGDTVDDINPAFPE